MKKQYVIDFTDQEPNKLINAVVIRDKKGKIVYNSGHIRFLTPHAQHDFATKCFENGLDLIAIRNETPHKAPSQDEITKIKRKGLLFCPYCTSIEKWKDFCPVCGMSIDNFYVKNANLLWNSNRGPKK